MIGAAAVSLITLLAPLSSHSCHIGGQFVSPRNTAIIKGGRKMACALDLDES